MLVETEVEVFIDDFPDNEVLEYAKELMQDRDSESALMDASDCMEHIRRVRKDHWAEWAVKWKPRLEQLLKEDEE
jgi:hypothetical protein